MARGNASVEAAALWARSAALTPEDRRGFAPAATLEHLQGGAEGGETKRTKL